MCACDGGRVGIAVLSRQIVETMPQSKEVEDFLRSIGPFYEEVEEPAQTDNTDGTKDVPTDSPEPVTINNTVTIETVVKETEENKELKSDSEEEIFSDPLVTPESLSVSKAVIFITELHKHFIKHTFLRY